MGEGTEQDPIERAFSLDMSVLLWTGADQKRGTVTVMASSPGWGSVTHLDWSLLVDATGHVADGIPYFLWVGISMSSPPNSSSSSSSSSTSSSSSLSSTPRGSSTAMFKPLFRLRVCNASNPPSDRISGNEMTEETNPKK